MFRFMIFINVIILQLAFCYTDIMMSLVVSVRVRNQSTFTSNR